MKNLKMFIVGFLLGGLLIGSIMFHQIQNRYIIGQNNGYLSGQYEVLHFLDKNIQNDLTNAEVQPNQFLNIKASTLNIVEINGVKTISLNQ